MGREKSKSDRTSLFFFSIFGTHFFSLCACLGKHHTNTFATQIHTHTQTRARVREREREKDDVEGKKSAVVVAFVLFFASSRLLFSFSFSEMSFIGEKKKQKRIIDDEFVTGGRRRSAIRDGDDDDTER